MIIVSSQHYDDALFGTFSFWFLFVFLLLTLVYGYKVRLQPTLCSIQWFILGGHLSLTYPIPCTSQGLPFMTVIYSGVLTLS